MYLGNFRSNDDRAKNALLGFAGPECGKFVETSSGGAIANFDLDEINFYVAANCNREALRFLANNIGKFRGVRAGTRGGPVPDLEGIPNHVYPDKFCIYAKKYRGLV